MAALPVSFYLLVLSIVGIGVSWGSLVLSTEDVRQSSYSRMHGIELKFCILLLSIVLFFFSIIAVNFP